MTRASQLDHSIFIHVFSLRTLDHHHVAHSLHSSIILKLSSVSHLPSSNSPRPCPVATSNTQGSTVYLTSYMSRGRLDGDPYGRWVPPPDPYRPGFPYHRGLDLAIQRHNAPPPFGPGYIGGSEREESHTPPMREVTQSEWCLQHPPEESPSSHPDTTLHTLHVVDEVACKDGHGAQVVRCYLDEDENQVYVAKIYDALYYSFSYYSAPVDVTWVADQDYRRETAAYEDLQQAGVDGLLTPKYYGSWTSDIALLDSNATRSSRIGHGARFSTVGSKRLGGALKSLNFAQESISSYLKKIPSRFYRHYPMWNQKILHYTGVEHEKKK
ncbi:hypothetical protein G7Z17_g6798 [Cylindrodendrum hubeiense]|uniref:Uncharacterized protein n=1 Tax=Cylindrodendrum hubeiense TaxID=595255 RepID=A0A9P5LFY7_9HYPO|nr:hypothetical protein G7Z17_g6798 [Cylindrodendrum hubeiense]